MQGDLEGLNSVTSPLQSRCKSVPYIGDIRDWKGNRSVISSAI